ncbi:MAG: AraC family transcriptional regulator [Massilibacteroides sp.]|nr:AraC family transcriptional regulator [Massilibacteroides sp.]
MKMKVWANGINKVACLSGLGSYKKAINIFPEGQGKIGKEEHLLYYSSSLFCIVRLDSSAKKASSVVCEFEGNGIVMSFQKRGKTSGENDQGKRQMFEKQNNIFFLNGFAKCQQTEADCFRIVLSKSYVENLRKLYPGSMAPLVEAYQKGCDSMSEHSHLTTTLEMVQIIKTIENLYLRQDEGKEMLIEAKIRELLYIQIMQHLKTLNKKDLKIEKYRMQMQMACQYIEENIRELLSLHDIAMAVGVCDTILKIGFKYFYGKTVFEYFNEYRLNKACDFLQDASLSISDVAFLAGFKHSSHFSTSFKQKYKITPIEYRIKNIEMFPAIKVG